MRQGTFRQGSMSYFRAGQSVNRAIAAAARQRRKEEAEAQKRAESTESAAETKQLG